MVELMFEKFQPPAMFLARNAVLSSFANGRQTSLNVDMGHGGTVGNLLGPTKPAQTAAWRRQYQCAHRGWCGDLNIHALPR